MQMSKLLVQTLRDAPSEAHTPGHQFLLRAGYMRGLSGGHVLLPLGALVRRQIEAKVCGALEASGGQPVSVPLARPAESTTGRGIHFRDRAQREMVLEESHADAILDTAAGVIRSYRQLPVLLYEAWQQVRDSGGGAGLFGAHEGRVVDALGLHADGADLAAGYGQVHNTLLGLLTTWDAGVLDVVSAEDDAHTAVGHRFIFPWTGGEEIFVHCGNCGYVADQAVARVSQEVPMAEAPLPTQDVETPNCKTIAELADFLGVPQSKTAKAVFLVANSPGQPDRFVFAVVRGDTALHEAKLKAILGVESVGAATEAEIRQAGAEPGYGSPVGLKGVTVVMDALAARTPNLVAGANRPGYHTLNVNYGRDFQATVVADIAMAQEGSPCPVCAAPLALDQGVALAEMRQVGDAPARARNAAFLNGAGQAQPLTCAFYRFYLDRIMAALAERHHDAHGLRWPVSIAPYAIYMMTLGKSSAEVDAAAARLYAELTESGFSVLFDDRDERAGVKFNDADLIGVPLRVVVGDRGLQGGTVEIKLRADGAVVPVALSEVLSYAAAALRRVQV